MRQFQSREETNGVILISLTKIANKYRVSTLGTNTINSLDFANKEQAIEEFRKRKLFYFGHKKPGRNKATMATTNVKQFVIKPAKNPRIK